MFSRRSFSSRTCELNPRELGYIPSGVSGYKFGLYFLKNLTFNLRKLFSAVCVELYDIITKSPADLRV